MIPAEKRAAQAFDAERPWRPQPFESHEAFAVFEVYLALEAPRRLSDVAKHFGRGELNIDVVKALAEAGYWSYRAEKWDAKIRAVRETATLEVAADTAKEEALAARIQLRIAARELRKLDAMSEAGTHQVVSNPRDMAKLRREATADLSRLRGEPSQRIEVSAEATAQFKQMSNEELAAFIERRRKAQSK